MRVLTNLKDTGATHALIGRLPIGTRHSTKSRVISRGFVRSDASANKSEFPQDERRQHVKPSG
jgi:hypothetical protein